MDLFDLFAKISIDTSEYDRGVDGASEKFQNLGKTLTSAGNTLTKSVTLPIAGLGASIIKTGADYEAGMSKVQAISGATAEEIAMLGDEAMRMASQTKFSTAESAEAYQYMAMAGWDANQMVDGLSGIMLLAAASGENLATTSDIVTDALTAFGLKASDSGRFADVLAAASNSANTNVSILGESFKYVAPVARAMGYSVEDVSVALGLMANASVKGSMAGTSLRSAITNMVSPTKSMANVMDEYGISLTDADGNMLSLAEIMVVLRERMGGLDRAAKTAAATTLFGKDAAAGMLAIIDAAPEDFDKLTESINNSAGTTEEMAAIMNDNAAGAMAMLSSAINVLFTNLSQFLIPAFTGIVQKITEAVIWFNNLDEGTQKLILTIAGIAAAVGPVLIVIGNIITAVGKIGTAVSGVIGVVKGVGTAVSGLFSILAANPIAAVIAAVAALVAGLVVLWNTNEDFRNAVGAIWEAITGFFTSAVDLIKAAWEGIGEFFSGIWESISSVFEGVVEFFRGIFEGAAAAVQAAWEAVVGFFRGVWEGIQSVFSTVADVLGGFFSAAASAVQAAWEAVVSFFSGVWDGIRSVFSSVAEVLGGFFSAAANAVQSAWSAVAAFFSGVWSGIQGVFSPVASVLGGFFKAAWEAVQGVWNAAKDFFSGVADGIRSVFESVTQFLADTFKQAWEAVKTAWNAAKEFFSGLWNSIKETASSAAGSIGDAFKKGWEAVKSAWNGATDFFKGIFDKIVGVFKNIGSKFLEIGRNIVSGLKDGITGAWSSFTSFIGGKVSGIVSGVKGALGIHSPSKVFAGIGENMVLGLSVGWDEQYGNIKRKIEKGMDFGTASIGLAANGRSCGNSGLYEQDAARPNPSGGLTVNIYNPDKKDAVTEAREWEKTSQRIALGLI